MCGGRRVGGGRGMGEKWRFSPRHLGFTSVRGTEHGTPQPVLVGRESAYEYGQGGASCEDVRAGQAVDDLALAAAVEVPQSGETAPKPGRRALAAAVRAGIGS